MKQVRREISFFIIMIIALVLMITVESWSTSIFGSATNSGNQNSMAMVQNMVAGGMFGYMGYTKFEEAAAYAAEEQYSAAKWAKAEGTMYMAMGALSFLQGGENGKTAGQNYNTAKLASMGGYDSTSDPLKTDEYGYPASMQKTEAYKANIDNLKNLAAKGYKVDPKTDSLIAPDGSRITGESFSDEAMADMGFPPEIIADIKNQTANVAAKAQSAARVSGVALDEGGGGGGMPRRERNTDEDWSLSGGGLGGLRRPSASTDDLTKVAGKSRLFNGEPIGVSQGNIFKTIERRYQLKEQQNSFLEM